METENDWNGQMSSAGRNEEEKPDRNYVDRKFSSHRSVTRIENSKAAGLFPSSSFNSSDQSCSSKTTELYVHPDVENRRQRYPSGDRHSSEYRIDWNRKRKLQEEINNFGKKNRFQSKNSEDCSTSSSISPNPSSGFLVTVRYTEDNSRISSIDRPNDGSTFEDSNRKRKRNESGNAPTRFYGYKYLLELSLKPEHEIVFEVMKVRSPFDTYLQKDLNPDWLFLILRIIRTVCKSSFKGNLCELLIKVCRSRFLTVLSKYLGEVAVETSKTTIQNLPTFVNDLNIFYTCVLDTVPSLANETDLRRIILLTKIAVDNMRKYLNLPIEEEISTKLDVLIARADDYLSLVIERLPKETKKTYIDRIANQSPPEDFRELSLYPTYEDVCRNNLGFVRPNKINGAYDSVEHYLDVQFRLLREDFIDPLRCGLQKYTEWRSNTSKGGRFKYENVRVYPDTCFEHVEESKDHKLGLLINFDPKGKLSKVRWERSKRFMYGSLLLFTRDDFLHFFCATVLDRNLTSLKSGKVLITLTENVKIDERLFKTPFLMAESEVFFEPYFLVMKLLKGLDSSTFPMKEYIVDGKSVTENPRYLRESGVLSIDDKVVAVHGADWPSAADCGLDVFQYEAFRTALTQEFCVIQGPPGTGKTYLGLKIAQSIWNNAKKNKNLKLPILVVCYTNHALDQFLEGMLKFTENIVRVGGQSQSEVLRKYNLRGNNNLSHIRRKFFSETISNTRKDIKKCREDIDRICEKRKSAETAQGLLRASLLQNVVQEKHLIFVEDDEKLQSWLLENTKGLISMHQLKKMYEELIVPSSESTGEQEMDMLEGEEDLGIVNEDDIFTVSGGSNYTKHYSVTVEGLRNQCKVLMEKFLTMRKGDLPSHEADFQQQKHEVRDTLQELIQRCNILITNMKSGAKAEGSSVSDGNQTLEDRWAIYWGWVSALRSSLDERLEKLEEQYRSKMVLYEEYKQLEDLHVVERTDVVGMTTTGAARLNLLLKSLKPTVVIVEEAAEVLESHIIASLTHDCQHVILIGDHEQLKPSTAVYKLSKDYNFNVSLFERMIKNGMKCPSLNVQHRMRPEISCLIAPLIYPDLKNHESVLQFDPIKGVSKNIYFVEHKVPEFETEDTASKQNKHEANFIIMLARYLVQQGYEQEKITILTTYTGQMFLLRDLKRNHMLVQNIRCIVVDKYQGEENDIILLSLVRSNAEGKIGFLNTSNRVCVALSRAKKGFYIIGNMDCLTKNSELWQKIKTTLLTSDSIGQNLSLYCSSHDKATLVSSAENFSLVQEGGCNLLCNELMECGHYCQSLCHSMNKEHKAIKCREPCKKTCPQNHPCKQQCYEECEKCMVRVKRVLPCKHIKLLPCHIDEDAYLCDKIVDDISPICNHPVKRKCHQTPQEAVCTTPCIDRLDCGHACTRTCHKNDDPEHITFKCHKLCPKLNKNCSKKHACKKLCWEECTECFVRIKFTLTCGHVAIERCSTDESTLKCFSKCKKVCEKCGQSCQKDCWENCEPCLNRTRKVIPECGHEILMLCSEEPKGEMCNRKCNKYAPCGHKCQSICRIPCANEKCMEIVKSSMIKSLCGHSFVYMYCHEKNNLRNLVPEDFLYRCQEPCNVLLECGDICNGTCGTCWQGRLHVPCKKPCGSTLICGHSCSSMCHKLCPPCEKPCAFRCQHSNCSTKCGIPCVPCQEPCEWKCKHHKCSLKCGAICNRIPCDEPCKLKVPGCGHDCIGFCGEPCPPQCRTCNPEITDIVFSHEDEPDARFVLLVDCKHTVESKALDQYLAVSSESGEVVMKTCPLCKTPITKTLRYMNYVKRTFQDIINVKKKIFDCVRDEKKREDLKAKLLLLLSADWRFSDHSSMLKTFLRDSCAKLTNNSKRPPISLQQFSTIAFLCEVLDPLSHKIETNEEAVTKKVIDHFGRLLSRLSESQWCVNRQRMLDLADEVRRCHTMISYCNVLKEQLYADRKHDAKVKKTCASINQELFGVSKFSQGRKENVKKLFKKLQIDLDTILSEDEKESINLAMSGAFGGSRGTWYSCPNKHYYCVTECGLAMEGRRCPECNEGIGAGSSYSETRVNALV